MIIRIFKSLMQVNSGLLAFFGISIYGVLKKIYHQQKKNKASNEMRLQNLEKAQVAILHNKIYTQCAVHLTEKFISIPDLDDLEYLFDAYKNLGGNGTGEELYREVKRLPKIKKEGM